MKRILFFLIFGLCYIVPAGATSSIARTGNCPAAAATSCTFGATATGDLKLIYAYRSGSLTAPSLPAGWTTIDTGATSSGGTTGSYRFGCNVSSSSGDTGSGTWTNASSIAGTSYSGTLVLTTALCNTQGVGGKASNNAKTSTTMNYATTTMVNGDSSSWVAGFGGSNIVAGLCTPAGMTVVTGPTGTPGAVANDTNAVAASWSSTNCTVTSATWMSYVVEILGHLTAGAGSPTVNNAGQFVGNPTAHPNSITSMVVNAGSNRALVCGISYFHATSISVSTVVFNTTESLAKISDANNPNECPHSTSKIKTEFWYLLNPSVTTATVTSTWSTAPSEDFWGCKVFNNVNQSTPFGAVAKACGDATATAPNVSVGTTTTTQLIEDVVAYDSFPCVTAASGVQEWNGVYGTNATGGAGQYKAGTGSAVNMNWICSGSGQSWSMMGVPINGPSAGPPSNQIPVVY